MLCGKWLPLDESAPESNAVEMKPMDNESQSQGWLCGFHSGEEEALQRLWHRFYQKLVGFADRRVRPVSAGMIDGEDIAQSVFRSLWLAAKEGRLNDVKNLDQIWWILVAIAERKCISHARRGNTIKRGGTHIRVSLDSPEVQECQVLLSSCLTAEYALSFGEEIHRLIHLLTDETSRQIAIQRIADRSIEEIAKSLTLSTATVNRKLRIIRRVWKDQL